MTWLTWSWRSLVVRGVLGILFGIVAIAWPISTVTALAVVWGIWALVDGFGELSQIPEQGSGGGKVALAVMAVISILAGLVAITSPGLTAVTLTWVLGLWLIVRGVFALAGAVSGSTTTSRGLLVVTGLLDLAIGILFAANPGRSAVSIANVLGVVALVWGIMFVVTGLAVRGRVGAATSA